MAAAQMVDAAGGQQPMKRPRPTDFSDGPGATDMTAYYPRDEDRAGYRAARDTEALSASYERFLRTGQIQTYGAGPGGDPPVRPPVGGNAGFTVDDRPMMSARGMDSRNIGYGGAMPEPPFPPDASNTLFIEGVPTGCTRREVSYIFRPFVGFREVRLLNKEPKHPGGDPIVLCFVDFGDAAQAAVALEALQAPDQGTAAVDPRRGKVLQITSALHPVMSSSSEELGGGHGRGDNVDGIFPESVVVGSVPSSSVAGLFCT